MEKEGMSQENSDIPLKNSQKLVKNTNFEKIFSDIKKMKDYI